MLETAKLFLKALASGVIIVSVLAVIGGVGYLVLLGRALQEWGRPGPSPVAKCTNCYTFPDDEASPGSSQAMTFEYQSRDLRDVAEAAQELHDDEGAYPPSAMQASPGRWYVLDSTKRSVVFGSATSCQG